MTRMKDDELKARLEALRQETADGRRETAAAREDTRSEFAAVRLENASAHVETRRHFEAIAERLEARFESLAESVE